MSQEAVGRLEALLARIKKNAALPRPASAVAVQASSAPAVEEEVVEDLVVEEAVVAAAPEPASDVMAIEDIDLLEEEIVDITDAEEAPAVEFAVEEEEPPASSRRPKAAASMSEALADAAQQLDAESGREIPLKTPPPESGPQAAPPPQGLSAPPVPQIEAEDLEADITSSPRAAAPPGPTPEQLGATIDLEEAAPADLELGEPIAPQPTAPSPVAPPPVSARVPSAPRAPEVVARPSAPAVPAHTFEGEVAFAPSTFVELLDASIALGS